jgi:hypothetical protein
VAELIILIMTVAELIILIMTVAELIILIMTVAELIILIKYVKLGWVLPRNACHNIAEILLKLV